MNTLEWEMNTKAKGEDEDEFQDENEDQDNGEDKKVGGNDDLFGDYD